MENVLLITSKLPVLAKVFDLDYKKAQIRFLKDNIEEEYGKEEFIVEALEESIVTVTNILPGSRVKCY